MSSRKQTPASKRANRTRINQTPLSHARSIDNLSSNRDTINRPIDFRSVTLSRNGSLPNFDKIIDTPTQGTDRETQLMLEYDKYLSSVELKYLFEKRENKIITNVNEQKNVFMTEFVTLYEQLSTLSEELEKKNRLKIEKTNMDKKIEVLEILNKNIVFDEFDGDILYTLNCTASKVVLKDFKEMNETDFGTVNCLLNEIIESLKELGHADQINSRIQLKDLLIKVATLTKDLDVYKLKCEELFDKIEHLQNNNSSLKILSAQFGKNPDPTLLPIRRDLMEDIKKEFDKI